MYFSPRTPEQGVYEFPRLTLLGFDTGEPQLRRLSQLGLKVKYMKVSCHVLPLSYVGQPSKANFSYNSAFNEIDKPTLANTQH